MVSRRPYRVTIIFSLVGALAYSSSLRAVPMKPLLEYRLNDVGTTTANTGTDSDPNLALATFVNGTSVPADLHTAGGLGVSGLPGDRAFNNSTASAMGTASTSGGGWASTGSSSLGFDLVSSLTITGWFNANTGEIVANKARMMDFTNIDAAGGDLINGGGAGSLSFQAGGNAVSNTAVSAPVYTGTGTWTFFAITADLTSVFNNVDFYKGDANDAVSLVSTGSIYGFGSPEAPQSVIGLAVGDRYSNDRPFAGLMDDLRFFGVRNGSGAVLGLSDLEAIREADLANVPIPLPEPACLGALCFPVVTLLKRRRRGAVSR